MTESKKSKKLLLIDANSLIHRSYHALPPLTTPDGKPIGAIYGLSGMVLKILKEEEPEYIAAAFDTPESTFREGLFSDYKAHRPKTDDELVTQLAEARRFFQKLDIAYFEKPGFEADDIIATLTRKFRKEGGLKIMILTGDLDTLQLVEKQSVVVKTPKKGVSETIVYDETRVRERYGLDPGQLCDYKGLVGDPSDNVPGVPGVGPKTASKLLQKYGDLENLYENLKEPASKVEEKILGNREGAFFSRKLVELRSDVPIDTKLNDLSQQNYREKELIEYFSELGFQSLIKRSFTSSAEPKNFPPVDKKNLVFILKETEAETKVLSSEKIKVAFDWKTILKNLEKKNVAVSPPIFDVKIAGWLIDPDQKDFELGSLSERFLSKKIGEPNPEILAELYGFFEEKLKEYELKKVFEQIEMPLVGILAKMEGWGVGIDTATLDDLEKEIDAELENLAKKIYETAGTVFNINSSGQVADTLFNKLKLEGAVTKTATGRRSTSSEALREIKDRHSIVEMIIDYRENFKIKTSFVRPLIDSAGEDNRIKTTFLQTSAATGRLASEKPNLQNLPQESKWSKKLRSAFVPRSGSSFLGLDYSQIELRLLAHVSGDENLRTAFREGADAHKITASRVFGVPPEKVTPEMRRLGKTLNFGVVYGMGPRAFASMAGISPEKAGEFIEKYFEDFPEVKSWQDRIKSEVHTFGFVKNENGRRRWFLGVGPKSHRIDEIERAAINMPVQSLGADIIKIAMIESVKRLGEKGWLGDKVRPVLTVHDELLFEVRDDILKSVSVFLKEIMENIYKISVPLKVEVKTGKNLGELKE